MSTTKDQESDSDSEDENESEGKSHPLSPGDGVTNSRPGGTVEAYREFLQFLQLGCYGSPIQGYPVIVVVLSTIPTEVRLMQFLFIPR